MTTDVEHALTRAHERWEQLFGGAGEEAGRDEGVKLAAWRPPCWVRGVGVVLSMNLFETSTYKGPSADVVMVPASRVGEVEAALDEFAELVAGARRVGLRWGLKEGIGACLGVDEVHFEEGMLAPDLATVARRRRALATMEGRFEAVARRMREVYGLRLPRYLATFAAFWASLDALERQGAESLGRSPGGIMVWFEDDGLERRTRGGLDARLECRFRCDPPEMVTVMWGDSDGLHFGLWYDDPADPPTYVVHNYARDSAETWRDEEPTPLAVLAAAAKEAIEDPYREGEPPLALHAVREALGWFAEADRAALAADPPAPRWLSAPRIPTLGTFGPGLPADAGSIRVGDSYARHEAYRSQPGRVQKWIASARRECAEGRPAAALTFGLDLHWVDAEATREAARELLVAAYEALGRRAHAETIKVHYVHRDLGSVGVFLRRGESEGGEGEVGDGEGEG